MMIRVEWRNGEAGLDFSARAFLLAAILWLITGVFAEAPKPPKFLRAPSVVGEHFAIEFAVWIEPHPDIRFVTAEAWDAEPMTSPFTALDPDLDLPTLYQLGALSRSSDSQPVTELNQHQHVFRFVWREGLDAGLYFLVVKIATKDFRPIKEARALLRVV